MASRNGGHGIGRDLPPRRPSLDYRPFPLRWPFLVATTASLAALVGLVVAACVVLPPEVDRGLVPGSKDALHSGSRRLSPRDTTISDRISTTPGFVLAQTPASTSDSVTVHTPSTTPQFITIQNPASTPDFVLEHTPKPVATSNPDFAIDDPDGPDEDDKPWGIAMPSSSKSNAWGGLAITATPTPTTRIPSTTKMPCDDFYMDEKGKLHMTPGGPEVTLRFGGRDTSASGVWTVEIIMPSTTVTSLSTIACSVHKGGQPADAFATGFVWTVDQWDSDITWTKPAPKTTLPPPAASTASQAFAQLTAAITAATVAAMPQPIPTTLAVTSQATPAATRPAQQTSETVWPGENWQLTTVEHSTLTVLKSDASVVSTVVTLRDTTGGPTATILGIMVATMSAFVQASVVTFSNSPGKPQTVTMLLGDDTPVYVKATVVTLTDASGVPTATVTNTPPPISTPTVITTAGPDGVLRTITTSVLAAPRTTTMTDAHGAPTATLTEYPTYPSDPPTGSKIIKVYEVSDIAYFVGFFLPTILSGLLTIPIRMIDLSAKQYQPWHELTRVDGAIAGESLALRTSGMYGMTSSVRSLAGGQALVFLTTLLTLCSIALVPLSSEAVALKLHGNCTTTDFKGCAMTLGVFLGPARATVVLLACMAFLVILILVALRQWRSGLAANPWTIAGIASLSMNKDVRALFSSLPRGLRGRIPHSRLVEALDGKFFKLGYSADRGTPEYGIVIDHSVEPGMARTRSKLSFYLKRSRDSDRGGLEDNGTKHHLPFLMLSYTWRAVFLLFLSGVLIIILYYNNTGGDTPFERFMDTQNLGVRALFTLVGIGITFYWGSFFTSLAILSPYHVLSKKGQPAEHSVLLAPPLHALGGIWSAIRRGHPFLVVVAFTSILAEFMPILLNNVPYRLTQTYTTHTVCTWLAVGILFFMWLVIVASFFVSWPHMPVDPSTIAGAMFYVCDSQMLASFEGLSVLSKEERNRRVRDMKAEFRFGQMRGVSGVRRVGVDRVYEPVYG